MKIIFTKNQHDKYMYDMVAITSNNKKFLIAIVHVDSVGDMGSDNYILKTPTKDSYYRDNIEAEIIF